MSQLLDVFQIISDLSNALAKIGARVNTGAQKRGSSAGLGVAATEKARSGRKKRVDEESSRELASVAHDLNERLEAQPLPDWVDGTSIATLRAITASNAKLMALTNPTTYSNGISAHRYAVISAAVHELIRDVSDYGRAVVVSQIEQVRAQNFTGDMAVDMRPSKATETEQAGAYGIVDDKPAGGATAFDESEMGALSAYQTPAASAATTPVPSRPSSPEMDLMYSADG